MGGEVSGGDGYGDVTMLRLYSGLSVSWQSLQVYGRNVVEESYTPDSLTPIGPFNVKTECIQSVERAL